LPAQGELIPVQASAEMLLAQALEWEEQGELDEAEELYRAALAASGANVEVNFLLAELLYRKGDLSAARERYYVAIELDENFVEARANLGCVLAEMGQLELAIAALEGALAYHGDYPDVHYHLARLLDRLERSDDATDHWKAFARLAAESPWAEEARDRLSQLTSTPPFPPVLSDQAGPGGN
jgi:tetratricopeptide (TPR) repeat protein